MTLKTHSILTSTIAALLALSPAAFAQKKQNGKPANAAQAVQSFSGTWSIDGGNPGDRVTIDSEGATAAVKWTFANGGGDAGYGVNLGGELAIGYGGQEGAGIVVFTVSGGTLSGVGALGKGAGFTEKLTGPASLDGKFDTSRGGTVTIRPGSNDCHLVVWSKDKRAGFGRKIGNKLYVAFHNTDAKLASLVIYKAVADGLAGQWWSEFGGKGGAEKLVRAGGVAAAGGGKKPRVDKYGNVIPDGPAPKGLEKPIDMPDDPKPAVAGVKTDRFGNVIPNGPAPKGLEKPIDMPVDPVPGKQPVAPIAPAKQPVAPVAKGGPAQAPAKGGQVDIETARKQLRADMPAKIAEFMKLHNDARAEVGVPPLQWDEKLAAYAQEWAENTAARSKMEHRPNGKYGENLAGYLPEYGERPVHGAKMWYDEKKDYRGEKIREGMNTGHYTQMVWRQSTHVGFGIAMQKDGMVMLCANYSPAGNMIGEHPYNEDGKPAAMAAGGGGNAGAPKGLEKPIDLPAGAPAPAAPVVGGMGVQLAKGWTNTKAGKTVTSVSPDGAARVVITTATGSGADGPWDDVQAKMSKHLAPHFPGLKGLTETGTEHDVFRDGVGLRVVSYTGNFNGVPVDSLVLIIRCAEQGSPRMAEAKKVAESLRLKK
jgi:uncharacterized protein YkwD